MCIKDPQNSITHGTRFLFAKGVKIVHALKCDDVGAEARGICFDFSVLDCWSASWVMIFSTEKNELLTCRRALNNDSISLPRSPIARRPINHELGLTQTASLNFSEHVVIQSDKGR